MTKTFVPVEEPPVMVSVTIADKDEHYLNSGDWKCLGSPTGAHWWVEFHPGSQRFSCRFCPQTRMFPMFLGFKGDDGVFIEGEELWQPIPVRRRKLIR